MQSKICAQEGKISWAYFILHGIKQVIEWHKIFQFIHVTCAFFSILTIIPIKPTIYIVLFVYMMYTERTEEGKLLVIYTVPI